MSRKYRNQQSESKILGLRQLQKTFGLQHSLFCNHKCKCIICRNPIQQKLVKQKLAYTVKSASWMHELLNHLTTKRAKTLRIFIPPICFPTQDGVEIFSYDPKEFRLVRLPNAPEKMIFHTMVHLKKQYKSMLQSSYVNKMIDQMNPQFMHKKYFNQLLPKFFHDGDSCNILDSNKAHFRNYVLHNNDKYSIAAIEQHKMNEHQPFCAIKYNDNNFTQVSQKDFEIQNVLGKFSDNLQDQISYIQMIIKSKQQSESFLYSEYKQGDQNLKDIAQYSQAKQSNKKQFQKAEKYVLCLLGAVSKYDDNYIDLQSIEDINDQLMRISSADYINIMTYSIVHYLAMVSNVYVKRIKLKWVINDTGLHFMQQILDYQLSQNCSRLLSFKLSTLKENQDFYRDSRYFIKVRKQIIQDSKANQAYDPKAKISQVFSKINSTVQYAQHNISNPLLSEEPPSFKLPSIPINKKKLQRTNKKSLVLGQRSKTLQLRDASQNQTIDVGSSKKTRYGVIYNSLRQKRSMQLNPQKYSRNKDFKSFLQNSTKNTTKYSIEV